MKPLTFEQALSKAEHLCSTAERAPQEIFEKLIAWGLNHSHAEKIVCELKKEKYIDEVRFTHAFIHDKFTYEHWGRIKIAYYLRNKGIKDSLITDIINDVIDEDEYHKVLSSLLKNKLNGMSRPLSQNDRAKLYRFATQRGFETNIISAVIKTADN